LVQAIRDIYNYFYDLTGERYTKTYLCEAYKIFLPGENVKHDPITFSETYSDEYSHHSRGFKAYRNEKGERIHALQVVLEARTWNKGFCLVLSIIEHYSSVVIIDEKTNIAHGGESRTRKIAERCVYDHSPDPKDQISFEQNILLTALASGELRGKYAEDIATSLYLSLFVKPQDSIIREILPEVAKFWDNWWKKSEEENLKKN
jgi:hypothetical protein